MANYKIPTTRKAVKKTAAKKVVAKKSSSKTAKKVVKKEPAPKMLTVTHILPNINAVQNGDTFVANVGSGKDKRQHTGIVFVNKAQIFFLSQIEPPGAWDLLEDEMMFADCNQDAVEEFIAQIDGHNIILLESYRKQDNEDLIQDLEYNEVEFVSIGETTIKMPDFPQKSNDKIAGHAVRYRKGEVLVGCTRVPNRMVKVVTANLIE